MDLPHRSIQGLFPEMAENLIACQRTFFLPLEQHLHRLREHTRCVIEVFEATESFSSVRTGPIGAVLSKTTLPTRQTQLVH